MIYTVEKMYETISKKNLIYKITYNDGKILFVPNDLANKDYQDIQKWIAEGGVLIDNPPLPTE
jgi:hypothetical protein